MISIYRKSFSGLQRNIWILALAMFVNRSGSMVLLFTSLYMTKVLHFSIGEAGSVMSLYGVGSILGSYAGGWLTDRSNYFKIMIVSLISSGLILLLMVWVKSLMGLACVVFTYAFTADIFRPANSKAIAAYSDPANRARSVSLVRLAINLGFTVGPAMGGVIALHLGYTWLFVVDALTSLLTAGLLYAKLPRQEPGSSGHSGTVLKEISTSAYRDYRYLAFIVLVALYGTCFFQIFASVPQYLSRVWNYHEDTIGLLLALNGFLVVLVEMPLVLWLEKDKNIFRYIIAGAFFLPLCFSVLLLGKGMLLWSVVFMLVITLSEIFAMPFMMNFALSRPLAERQGQYAALYSIAFGIANITAPVVGLGIANHYGFENMFYVLILLSLVCVAGFLLLSGTITVRHSPVRE